MAPFRRPAPYKDFLQPALHRRFSTTALILLGLAFIEAVIFSTWRSLFWTVFPFGPTGIRAFFIFLCSLFIIFLRIAQYHVGLRTSTSGFQTFLQYAATFQTLEALVSYILSSWLFCQIFLWSASSDFAWVSVQTSDRARLNEKPVFYTVHSLLFGLVQGALHISLDEDRLRLGSISLEKRSAAGEKATSGSTRLLNEVPLLVQRAMIQSLAVLGFNLVFYHVALRGLAWRTALAFFRPFYTLPKTNVTPATLGGMSFHLWISSFYTGCMLLCLWLAGNKLFSHFLVRPPVKNGRPLTYESRDPNGSLLNGLKSKKLSIKCFAMWELALIAGDCKNRRRTIYQDIGREDGPIWSQVYALCLDVVKGMKSRLDDFEQADFEQAPLPASTAVVVATPDAKPAPAPSKPASIENILLTTARKKSLRAEVGKIARITAVSPGQASRLNPIVEKGVAQTKGCMEQITRQVTGSDGHNKPVQRWTRRFLDSPVGRPFKQTFSRRMNSAVLGSPYGEPSLFLNAIAALTRLAVFSLAEDSYGKVQRDVPDIIRTFTAVIVKLESAKSDLPLHWTDFGGQRDCAEVDAISDALKKGLELLIGAFGPYARDLRLTLADMRHARGAAGLLDRESEAGTD